MVFSPIYNTREMAGHVRESFVWRWRRALRPPCPLPEDFHALCPRFSMLEAKGTAADFELPEMVQATFYAMLLNKAVELGAVRGFMAECLKSALVGLSFEVWMSCVDHKLRKTQFRRQVITVKVHGPQDGQKESSGSNGPPAPSSDEKSHVVRLRWLAAPLRSCTFSNIGPLLYKGVV
ncbi:LOW QUALITY PROTEIN: hypothetical protein Cgig2_012916 [Carnegiea gigantea]|uniref:Uncharacterized protein n=1 Tax=Carnegiea gigantea TaxID=171969 RepID=A0A9Q1JTD2_9CARY|nr:LOW QUALITY PROTEIN: hypothetical protein Cgig2_012916 [Carnegiea gigantea]